MDKENLMAIINEMNSREIKIIIEGLEEIYTLKKLAEMSEGGLDKWTRSI